VNGALSFPSVVDLVAGTRVEVAPARTWRIEIADVALHHVTGLHTGGARAAVRLRAFILTVSVARLASPVGAHDRAVVEAGVLARGAWQGALRAGVERLLLDRAAAATWRVAGVISRVDVGRVSMIADLDVIQGHALYETTLSLSGVARVGAAQLIGSVRIDGDRFAGSGLSISARVHTHLSLLAGYHDGTESLRAGAVIGWGGIEVAAGVSQHPVLGLSQGVSIACAR
jgi:hypothetical protein